MQSPSCPPVESLLTTLCDCLGRCRRPGCAEPPWAGVWRHACFSLHPAARDTWRLGAPLNHSSSWSITHGCPAPPGRSAGRAQLGGQASKRSGGEVHTEDGRWRGWKEVLPSLDGGSALAHSGAPGPALSDLGAWERPAEPVAQQDWTRPHLQMVGSRLRSCPEPGGVRRWVPGWGVQVSL